MHFAIYASVGAIVVILLAFAFILGANVAQPESIKHWFERFQEFIAAMIGLVAAVGLGIAAWVSVQRQLEAQTRIRDEDKDFTRKALARSLLFKLAAICDQQRSIWEYFESTQRRMISQKCEAWMALPTLVNSLGKIIFSAEEMELVLSLDEDKFFSDLFLLDTTHTTNIDLANKLSETKGILLNRFEAAGIEGELDINKLTPKQASELKPRMLIINNLFQMGHPQITTLYKRALKITADLSKVFHSKLGLNPFPRVDQFPQPK